MRPLAFSISVAFASLLCVPARCQTIRLRTRDTVVNLERTRSGAAVARLSAPGRRIWTNRASEPLIAFVEAGRQRIALRWKFNSEATLIREREVALVYESASPHLRLTSHWRARQTFGPIEHQIRIENLGSHDIWLPMQDTLDFDLKIDPQDKIEHVFVEKGATTPSATGTHRDVINEGYRWTGTSSTYGDLDESKPREIIPWSLVKADDHEQSGWYVGIEFSGRTRIAIVREQDSLKVSAGLNPDPVPFRTRLVPGEAFETPTVFVGAFRGGVDEAGNILRRWVREVLGNSETWKDPRYPYVVNNSWGGGVDVNEEIATRMIRDSASLGVEMFHVDAGWFRGVGDWHPNPKKFPHGLTAIAENAHQHGLKFGLWVDWTQAGISTEPGALNARDPKVRDWMVTDLPADWEPESFKGQTIDIGMPEAKQWAEREVERIVTDYHLDMLEHDGYLVAHGCDRSNHPHAAPDPLNKCIYKSSGFYFVDSTNSTDVSYHATRAYYAIYSKLRREHPGLIFEGCNDGGRMVDFGSAAHVDYFSITDTYDPVSNRRAFYDTSYVLPAPMLESYVEKWPTPRIENFRYMLRSGMMGWLSIMMDTALWTAEQRETAKNEIQMYKSELRPLIRDADLYHISSRPDGVHWDAIEYFDPSRKRGAIYVFRGSTAQAITHRFVLKGLDPASRYRVTFQDHSSAAKVVRGADLMKSGLLLQLPLINSSEIVSLKEEAPGR